MTPPNATAAPVTELHEARAWLDGAKQHLGNVAADEDNAWRLVELQAATVKAQVAVAYALLACRRQLSEIAARVGV
jgi:hypothetical protein